MNPDSVCYLSLTEAVCGHKHKSDGPSPVWKKKKKKKKNTDNMKFFYFLFSHFPVLEIKSWHTLTRQPLLTNFQDTDFFQSI